MFGGETDLQISGADDTFAPWKFSNPWFGTLRGRAGYAFNNILLYGTLGLAYGDLKGELLGADETKTETGWAGGLGAEVGFTPNWSAKVEYLYMDLAAAAIRSPAWTTACRPTCFASASTITSERRIAARVAENPGPRGPGFFFAGAAEVPMPT